MGFERIINQKRPKEILARALEHKRVPHAYLFNGPEGVGKEALAIELAKALFCKSAQTRPCGECSACRRVGAFNHPDFIYLFPMPKSAKAEEEREILESLSHDAYARKKPWANPTISIDRIRELRHISTLKPLEGLRVVVVAEADKMTQEAANSLLKILEEPPPAMHLILTTNKLNALLPTIVSRCQEIRFESLPDAEIEQSLIDKKLTSPENAAIISRISQGSFSRALEWIGEDLEERRNSVIEFMRTCLKDDLAQIEFVEEFARSFDKRAIKDILSLSLVWLRDALVLLNSTDRLAASQRLVVNIDKLDLLEKFISAFEKIDFDLAFTSVERSIELIDRNVQLNLILFVLLSRLQKAFIIKGMAR
jgi:DNA polymerase-3 subunit delta'